jgi:hypothetical protein
MSTKSLLMVALLVALTVVFASAKTYQITLPEQSVASGIKLKAGEYNVSVDGPAAVFTNVDTSRRITVPVKIEKAQAKHSETSVTTTAHNGSQEIESIELAGTYDTLQFGAQ